MKCYIVMSGLDCMGVYVDLRDAVSRATECDGGAVIQCLDGCALTIRIGNVWRSGWCDLDLLPVHDARARSV